MAEYSYSTLKSLCTTNKEKLPKDFKCTASAAVLKAALVAAKIIPDPERKRSPRSENNYSRWKVAELLDYLQEHRLPEPSIGSGKDGRIVKDDLIAVIKNAATKASPKKSPKKEVPKQSPKKSPKKELSKTSPKKSPKKEAIRVSPKKSPKKEATRVSPKKSPKSELSKQSPKKELSKYKLYDPGQIYLSEGEVIKQLGVSIRQRGRESIDRAGRNLNNIQLIVPIAINLGSDSNFYYLGVMPWLIDLLPKGYLDLTNKGYKYLKDQENTKKLGIFIGTIREFNNDHKEAIIIPEGRRNKAYGIIGYDTPFVEPKWLSDAFPIDFHPITNPVRLDEDNWILPQCQAGALSDILGFLSRVDRDGQQPWIGLAPMADEDAIENPAYYTVVLVDGAIYHRESGKMQSVDFPEQKMNCLALVIARALIVAELGFAAADNPLPDEYVVLVSRAFYLFR